MRARCILLPWSQGRDAMLSELRARLECIVSLHHDLCYSAPRTLFRLSIRMRRMRETNHHLSPTVDFKTVNNIDLEDCDLVSLESLAQTEKWVIIIANLTRPPSGGLPVGKRRFVSWCRFIHVRRT